MGQDQALTSTFKTGTRPKSHCLADDWRLPEAYFLAGTFRVNLSNSSLHFLTLVT